MEKKKIIIAEDEKIIALDLQRLLEKEGYQVTSVSATAIDIIEKAESEKPDLILMDIMLEGELDGIEAAQIISYKHNIPIIFITAFKDRATVERVNLANPAAYIIKPFDDEVLLNNVYSILERVSVN